MKTTFLYGLGMAIAGTVVALALFFLGFHDSPEKLSSAQWVGGSLSFVITVAGIVMAVRARREETPEDEAFGYGRALGAGTLTALWGSLFGNVFNVLYMTVINPNMQELIVESQLTAMEEKGMSAAQIDQAEGMIRMMTNPALQGVFGFIAAFLFGFVIALIVAAFVRRAAVESYDETPPPLQS